MTPVRHKLLAALAAVPLLLLTAATPAPAAATGYVALGDSYAAGVAAGAYDPASGDCHRSTRAYPALLAAQAGSAPFLDLACNGATSEDVLTNQVPSIPAGTGLVTLTAGGNDLGFADAVIACLQPFTTDAKCYQALDHSAQVARDDLPGRVDRLLDGIGRAAPGARVVVTGYPDLLHTGTTCFVGTDARRKRFDALTDQVDALLQQRAQAHGDRFADPRGSFADHEICAAHGTEWITRIVLTPLWESFHPTAEGQAHGYLPVVAAAVGG
ncbi:SGNH/GDSL hydrolase family protein [Kitasatospora mediocidica]|uniref:SGNH/GDSL hydrolase family protein n=1 Tax=Kitasatospora mediocidica TaxID=58352 RepID=UPI000563E3E6|nr:SGNH/GDSL hydrolase family protein [Kitasatospora mediocidica]